MRGPKAKIAVLLCLGLSLVCITKVTGQQNPFEIRKRHKPDTAGFIGVIQDTLSFDTVRVDTITLPDSAVDSSQVIASEDSLVEVHDTSIQRADTVGIEETRPVPIFPETDTQADKRKFHLDLLERIRDWQDSYTGTIATTQSFLFVAVIFFLIYLTILLGMNRSLPRRAFRAITNDNYLRFLQRDFNSYSTIYWMYYLLFFLNAGFFIFLLVQHFALLNSITMLLLLLAVIIITGIYVIKHLVLFSLGIIFPVEMETSLFSFVIMLLNILFGLILMPLNIIIAFAPLSVLRLGIWIGCLSFVLLYLYRQLKGVFISSRFISEYRFHFFLYLCAVEIAPLLIIYKVVSGQLGIQ